MILHHSKGGRRIKMKKQDRFNCKNCGANISEDEMIKNAPFCPVCGKKAGWRSDPIFYGFDDLDEE